MHYLRIVDHSYVREASAELFREFGGFRNYINHKIEGVVEVPEKEAELTIPFDIDSKKKYYLLYCIYFIDDTGGCIEWVGLYEDRDRAETNKELILKHNLEYRDSNKAPRLSIYNHEGKLQDIEIPWLWDKYRCLEDVVIKEVHYLEGYNVNNV